MTDVDPAHPVTGGDGDGPDTFDDRLTAIVRLIDTADDDPDPDRRQHRRVVAGGLLARLGADALAQVAIQLDRLVDL